MSIVIGIDVGGSTTKIVGLRKTGGKIELIEPELIKACDPLTSAYGAFGKFTDENKIKFSDISKVMITGVGSSYVKDSLYGLDCERVEEFNSIGSGGLYLSGLPEALERSLISGTLAARSCKWVEKIPRQPIAAKPVSISEAIYAASYAPVDESDSSRSIILSGVTRSNISFSLAHSSPRRPLSMVSSAPSGK